MQDTPTMNDHHEAPNLVRLDERMAHVMRAIDDIKTTLETMPTRIEIAALVSKAEHSASVTALANRIENVEIRVKAISPLSLLDTVQKVAVTLSSVAAAGGLIAAVVHFVDRVPK